LSERRARLVAGLGEEAVDVDRPPALLDVEQQPRAELQGEREVVGGRRGRRRRRERRQQDRERDRSSQHPGDLRTPRRRVAPRTRWVSSPA